MPATTPASSRDTRRMTKTNTSFLEDKVYVQSSIYTKEQEKTDENSRNIIRLIGSGTATNLNSICTSLTGAGYNPHYAEHLHILHFVQAVIKRGYVRLTRQRTSLENFIISERLEITKTGKRKFFHLLDVDDQEPKRDTVTPAHSKVTVKPIEAKLDYLDLIAQGQSHSQAIKIIKSYQDIPPTGGGHFLYSSRV